MLRKCKLEVVVTESVLCYNEITKSKEDFIMKLSDKIGSVSAWYAEDGIHLSYGKSVRYDRSAQIISWERAAERIGELLESGQFASNLDL